MVISRLSIGRSTANWRRFAFCLKALQANAIFVVCGIIIVILRRTIIHPFASATCHFFITKSIIHNKTPAADRKAIMETWSKVDSPIRVLIVSPLSELDVIVPDVGNMIVLSREGPEAMGPRWQRMARMEHQRGCYMQIINQEEKSSNDDYKLWNGTKCGRDRALEVIAGDQST